MQIDIQWKDGTEWKAFDTSEIYHMPRTHAINLFSNSLAVRSRQGDTRITNRQEIKKQYEAKGVECLMFSDLRPSNRPLLEVGLVDHNNFKGVI